MIGEHLRLQVAGLTNNSCVPEAAFLRHCVLEHRDLGNHVLEVAKVGEGRGRQGGDTGGDILTASSETDGMRSRGRHT